MFAAQADAERIKVGEVFNVCILYYSETSHRLFLVASCNIFVLSCCLAVHPVN